MRTISRLIVFGIIKLLFISCEKEVVLDLPGQSGRYVVIEANIDNSSPRQWIRLSRSTSYYETGRAEPVSDALVIVTDGERDFIFDESLADSLEGYYTNREIGRLLDTGTYKLIVEYDDYIYTAHSEFKPVPEIDSVTVEVNFFSRAGIIDDLLYDVYLHFKRPDDIEGYYSVDMDIDGRLQTGRPSQKTLLHSDSFDDYVSVVVKTINSENIDYGESVNIYLRSISREKFEFYQVFFFQTDLSGNPFAGAPPANIPTNIEGGALGFFQVSAKTNAGVLFEISEQ